MTDVVAVLGMHRSGTSAITGVLTKLGGEAPKSLLPANSGNRRGYFESVPLMYFHDELLASAGCHWHDWRKFNPSWYRSPVVKTYKERAKKLFQDEFTNAPLPILKDPRICRFAPFWLDVFEDMGMTPRIVMPIRSPLDVAQSLKSRDMMSTTKALLLWLRHVLDAEAQTRNIARSIFTWEQFLSDWRGTTDKISLETGLAWSRLSDRTGYEIDKFLSAELVHHRTAHTDLVAHSDVHEWTLEAYDALLELARNPFSNSATERLDRVRALFDQSSDLFGRVLVDYEINLEESQTQATAFQSELDLLRNQRGEDEARFAAVATERGRLAVELDANRQQLTNTAALLNERTQSLGTIEAQLAAANQEKEQLFAALAQHQAELAAAAEERQRISTELHERVQEIGELSTAAASHAEHAVQVEAQLAVTHQELTVTHQELTEARQEKHLLLNALETREKELGAALEELQSLVVTLQARETSLLEVLDERGTLAARAEQAEAALGDLASERDRLSKDLAAHAADLAASVEERGRLASELQKREQTLAEVGVRQADLIVRAERAEVELARVAHERVRLSKDLAAHAADLAASVEERGRLASELQMREQTLAEVGARQAEFVVRAEHAEAEATALALELRHMEITADRAAEHAAVMVETETKLAAQIHALRAQMIDTEAALAKSNATRDSLVIMGMRPLANRRLRQWERKLERSGLFDADWYKDTYSDVAKDRRSPVRHYLEDGYLRGYRPNPLFDTRWYLERYDDVRHSGVNPLLHYILHGHREGRDPCPEFQTGFYLETNPDVRGNGMNPLAHYLRYGRHEGRLGSRPRD